MSLFNKNTKNVTATDPWLCTAAPELDNHSKPLQEPVPFEDFKFSFGLDPDVAVPISFDPPLALPAQLSEDPFFFPFSLPHNSVLDEDDQKVFSTFLDTFFMDQDATMTAVDSLPSLASLYDTPGDYLPPPPLPFQTATYPEYKDLMLNEYEDTAYSQSIHSYKLFNDHLQPEALFLQQTALVGSQPSSTGTKRSAHQSIDMEEDDINKEEQEEEEEEEEEEGRLMSGSSHRSPKRSRPQKELLTEDEKRANHIASEQKRRSTIRSGFKDLTDLIPALKNINHSKSTVLFKAVDYIHSLEKKTKQLQDRMKGLQLRAEMQGFKATGLHPAPRAAPFHSHSSHSSSSAAAATTTTASVVLMRGLQTSHPTDLCPETQNELRDILRSRGTSNHHHHHHQQHSIHGHPIRDSISNTVCSLPIEKPTSKLSSISTAAAAALLEHKAQQQQLLALQEKLQHHQKKRKRAKESKRASVMDPNGQRPVFYPLPLREDSRSAFYPVSFDSERLSYSLVRSDVGDNMEGSEDRLKATIST
ncbi:hypothetical protein BDF14DRAFT_343401 [Spinellus fusiger]|nr:hypothetical protein BDF14DRAFT_343401 [Spinellus fusiger]